MKTIRSFTLLLITLFFFSAWTPAQAAPPADTNPALLLSAPNNGLKAVKYVTLTVDNRTGGALYITLDIMRYGKDPTPRQDYFLLAQKQGKNQFLILPGRYIYTIRSTNCGGHKRNTKLITGDVILGPYYCGK